MRRELLLWQLWTAALLSAAAAAFYVPALARTHGLFPAPLDDVYIYYGFARSAALGHPFEHFPGNGYSSGATSVLYPLLLAPFWALGLRADRLGIAAAVLAFACLFDLCRSLRALARERPISWLMPPLVVAVPLLGWSFWSGMESALFAAVLGRSLLGSARALDAPPARRARAQLRAGLWLALLPLTRPEAVTLTATLGIAVVHGARGLPTWPSLGRALGPGAAALGLQALANRWMTGEWAPAGAVRKLLTSTPYLDAPAAAVEVVTNAIVLLHQAFVRALGGVPGALLLLSSIALAIAARATRRLALALLCGSAGALALVCLNATARYQNYRYAAAPVAMLLCAAALGLVAARRPRAAMVLGGALCLAPVGQHRRQIDHFARASANIAEQQARAAARLAALDPPPRRVLVGDAGAIPYLSGIAPLDGLGLGGFRQLPFARASVHGTPAVVELIERLSPEARPDAMALYPSWWGGLADVFGTRIDGVRIDDNVICGGDEKVLYRADWSALSAPSEHLAGELDALDVADLVEERAHRFELPDHGGWIVAAIHPGSGGAPRWDAGRIVPAGERVAWTFRDAERGDERVALRLRSDERARVEVVVAGDGRELSRRTIALDGGPGWIEQQVPLDGTGDRLVIVATTTLRLFHAWLVRR